MLNLFLNLFKAFSKYLTKTVKNFFFVSLFSEGLNKAFLRKLRSTVSFRIAFSGYSQNIFSLKNCFHLRRYDKIVLLLVLCTFFIIAISSHTAIYDGSNQKELFFNIAAL